tara:strand:+ start:1 stop:1497 length:1497 start_codon:yes stop_codon:yes gene_type:complete
MMGMMDGGRVPYAEGTAKRSGFAGFLYDLYDQVADKFGGSVKYAEPEFPEGLTGEKREQNPVFVPDPSKNVTNQVLEFPRDYQRVLPERSKPKLDRGTFVKSAINPMDDRTLLELGLPTQFKSNVQRKAEGGFIGEYNYAQPQQATMGTPFPNAVDSNPQQSQSFLRPNDAKKNSRVGLADGTTPHDGSLEILPLLDNPRKKDKERADGIKYAFAPKGVAMEDPTGGVPSNTFVDVQPSEGGFEQADNQVKEELGNDPIFAYEIAGGSLKDLQKILSGELSTNISKRAFDGFYLKRYMDNASTPNPTIGGINLNALEKDEKELKNKEKISLAEYLPYHRKRLEKANAWVDAKIKENSDNRVHEENYEKARGILVDMHFNLGAGGLNKFKKMIRAISEGDWSRAEIEIGKKAGGTGNNEYLQVHRRVKGKDVPQFNSDGSPKLIQRAVRNKERLAELERERIASIPKPRANPRREKVEIPKPRANPRRKNKATGGFINP